MAISMKKITILSFIVTLISLGFNYYQYLQSKKVDNIARGQLKSIIELDTNGIYKSLANIPDSYKEFNANYPHIKIEIQDIAGNVDKLKKKLERFAQDYFDYNYEK